MHHRRSSIASAIAVAIVLALAVAGCSPSQSAAPAGGSPSSGGPAQPTPIARLRLMTPGEKQSLIASSFPTQVPVPFGSVSRGEAQGDSAWDYQLAVGGDSAGVALWYQQAYGRAEWRLIKSSQADGTQVLDFAKNGAESRVRVEPGTADGVLVTVSVGVGTPVLQTQ